jgi:prepilin-type N-terminal cleavage/methylation domain-containing protein
MKAESQTANADCRQPAADRRTGLSLLEVMLAIAILGLALATTGELVRLGTQAAGETRDLTKAQILCEGIMSELSAGVIPLESADENPFELDPEWTYSVTVGPLDEGGLMGVMVMVQKEVEETERPVYFTLTRWMIDPLLEQVVDSKTILGGESDTSSQSGAGQSGDANNNQAGQAGGGQNGGGQAAGGGFGGGGFGGGNQADPNSQGGGPGGMNQGGRGGQPGGGGQFGGGGRQGGGGQFGGGRQGGSGQQPGGGGGGQFGGGRQGGGGQQPGGGGGARGGGGGGRGR